MHPLICFLKFTPTTLQPSARAEVPSLDGNLQVTCDYIPLLRYFLNDDEEVSQKPRQCVNIPFDMLEVANTRDIA